VRVGYLPSTPWTCSPRTRPCGTTLVEAFPYASIGSLRSLAGGFGFSATRWNEPVRVLSGGEKARLVLARMLFDPPSFLVLDEPTNHLDIGTRDMLMAALADFQARCCSCRTTGVSWARWSTRVLELTAEGCRSTAEATSSTLARTGREAQGCGPLGSR